MGFAEGLIKTSPSLRGDKLKNKLILKSSVLRSNLYMKNYIVLDCFVAITFYKINTCRNAPRSDDHPHFQFSLLPYIPTPKPPYFKAILIKNPSAVIYSHFSSESNAQLAVPFSVRMVPKCFPSGLITKTPPGPVAKRVPLE